MASSSTKAGHLVAKALGIKLNYREYGAAPPTEEKMLRGESVFSVSSADKYVETEPTVWEWIEETTPSGHDLANYCRSLFPFTHWILRYNVQWLIGDLVAGEDNSLPDGAAC